MTHRLQLAIFSIGNFRFRKNHLYPAAEGCCRKKKQHMNEQGPVHDAYNDGTIQNLGGTIGFCCPLA